MPIVIYGLHAGAAAAASLAGIAPVLHSTLWHGQFTWFLVKAAMAWLPILYVGELWRSRDGLVPAFGSAARSFRVRYLSLQAIAGVVLGSAFIAHESLVHSYWKRMLGSVRPYRWDVAFERLDRALHFGRPPWEWLHPVVGQPAITAAIDAVYWVWFPITIAFGCWVVWLADRQLRARALATWALLWVILGTIVAQVFSSAGPVYYDRIVGGADPYIALKEHLALVDATYELTALNLQAHVWENVSRGNENAWLSMSAMPSMHIALPVLFSLVLWRAHRPLGLLMWAYTGLVFVGSVSLGWHYAVDGYVSVAVVCALWWFTGTFAPAPAQARQVMSLHQVLK